MSSIAVTVCRSCPAGRAGFAKALEVALDGAGLNSVIAETECMSGCTRPSTAAFRSPGKTAYLFGDLDLGDIPLLVTFAALYAASPDGNFADARPLGALREKALARIPG